MQPDSTADTNRLERNHALEFLRRSSGVLEFHIEPALLDDVFLAISGNQVPKGKSPAWIDDLIGDLRRVSAAPTTFNLCLSHDVDYVSSRQKGRKFVRRLGRALFAEGSKGSALMGAGGSILRMLSESPRRERYGDFMDWLRLEERFGFRSTFFFLPYPDTDPHVCDGDYRFTDRVHFDGRDVRVTDMMREIASAGWEVGLHGTFNSACREGLLKRQKETVEKIIGKEVTSIRQHYLHHVPGLTHRLQSEAGLRVDSTLGYNRAVGLKLGTSHPFPVWDAQSRTPLPLMEVPLTAMDTSLVSMGLHKTGPSGAIANLKNIGSAIAASGGVFCLNWHPHYLPVPAIHEVYVELLSWARGMGATARRMDSFAEPRA